MDMAKFKLSEEQIDLLPKYARHMTFRTIGTSRGDLPTVFEHTIKRIVTNEKGTFIYTIPVN